MTTEAIRVDFRRPLRDDERLVAAEAILRSVDSDRLCIVFEQADVPSSVPDLPVVEKRGRWPLRAWRRREGYRSSARLVDLLASEDESVRAHAENALVAMGRGACSALYPALRRAVESDCSSEHFMALETVFAWLPPPLDDSLCFAGSIGGYDGDLLIEARLARASVDEITASALRFLESADDTARHIANEHLLHRLDAEGARLADELRELLVAEMRRGAGSGITIESILLRHRWHVGEVIDSLAAQLEAELQGADDTTSRIGYFGIASVVAIAGEKARALVPALAAIYDRSDDPTRKEVVAALAQIGGPDAHSLLRAWSGAFARGEYVFEADQQFAVAYRTALSLALARIERRPPRETLDELLRPAADSVFAATELRQNIDWMANQDPGLRQFLSGKLGSDFDWLLAVLIDEIDGNEPVTPAMPSWASADVDPLLADFKKVTARIRDEPAPVRRD